MISIILFRVYFIHLIKTTNNWKHYKHFCIKLLVSQKKKSVSQGCPWPKRLVNAPPTWWKNSSDHLSKKRCLKSHPSTVCLPFTVICVVHAKFIRACIRMCKRVKTILWLISIYYYAHHKIVFTINRLFFVFFFFSILRLNPKILLVILSIFQNVNKITSF